MAVRAEKYSYVHHRLASVAWEVHQQTGLMTWAYGKGPEVYKRRAYSCYGRCHDDRGRLVYFFLVLWFILQEEHVYHGVGTEASWRRLTRDLVVDLQKGWALLDRPKRKSPRNKFKVWGIKYLKRRDLFTFTKTHEYKKFYTTQKKNIKNLTDHWLSIMLRHTCT